MSDKRAAYETVNQAHVETDPAGAGDHKRVLSSVVFSLSVFEGPDAGRKHIIRRPSVTIGRDGADLQLSDRAVAARHCVVEVSGLEVRLRDLGLDGGTRVNGEPVSETTLHDRDEIRIGGSGIVFTAVAVAERPEGGDEL